MSNYDHEIERAYRSLTFRQQRDAAVIAAHTEKRPTPSIRGRCHVNETQIEISLRLVDLGEWTWQNIGWLAGCLVIVGMMWQTFNEWKNK